MGCEEVLALLREREASCRREAERLRGEAERITALLAVCEQELARVATAYQVVGELPVAHGAAEPVAHIPSPRAQAPAPGGGEVAGEVGEFAARVLTVLAAYAGPVRCRQVVEALGLEATPREVERVRHQLKKAAAAGRVVQTPGGLFTLTRAHTAASG
jgi:hypothetical protein